MRSIHVKHQLCHRRLKLSEETRIACGVRMHKEAVVALAVLYVPNEFVLKEYVVRSIVFDVYLEVFHDPGCTESKRIGQYEKKPSLGDSPMNTLQYMSSSPCTCTLTGEGGCERGFLVKVRLYYFKECITIE